MFDRNLYDRNNFDRGSVLEIKIEILFDGKMFFKMLPRLKIRFKTTKRRLN